MSREADDLSGPTISQRLPGREVLFYPTVVSTEAVALTRARSGAPEGSLVVAEHQVSPRLRPGRIGPIDDGEGLSFSLLLRPQVAPLRGGWLYLVATTAVVDILGADAAVEWPDEVYRGERLAATVSVHLEATVRGLEWALVSVMARAPQPRVEFLGSLVEAIEARYHMPPESLVAEWVPRCRTLGRAVAVSLYPVGAGRPIVGTAVGVRPNGALMLKVSEQPTPILVRPQDLAGLEDLGAMEARVRAKGLGSLEEWARRAVEQRLEEPQD